MKKFILIQSLLFFGFTSNAQVLISILLGDELNSGKVEFGLQGGGSWSTLKNLNGAESLGSFNLGFYFDIKLKNPSWMLNTGVMVKSSMGAENLPIYSLNNLHLDSAFAGGTVTRKINYFNVPVLMKYSFKNNLFVKGGIQLGLRHKAFDEFQKTVNDEDDLNYKLKTKDNYHPIDAGMALGIGYRLMKGNGMNLDFQYYYGLVDIVMDDTTPDQYNRAFYVTVGIPIGKNSKQDKSGTE